jgi:hypothetical protein
MEAIFFGKENILPFSKGQGFIELLDNRPLPNEERSIRTTLLNDLQSNIYEFCDPAKSVKEICEQVKAREVHVSTVLEILEEFVQRGFMYQEGKRYLHLAMPA